MSRPFTKDSTMTPYYGSEKFDTLIGQPLAAVTTSDDQQTVTFILQNGTRIAYGVEGDCCSSTWIEHVTVPTDIAGATIRSTSEPELPPHGPVYENCTVDDRYYEYVQVYHTAFQTDRGEIILEYRNESNGYYGGWLTGPTVTTEPVS